MMTLYRKISAILGQKKSHAAGMFLRYPKELWQYW